MPDAPTSEQLRDRWLDRLSRLILTVQGWADARGWATRQIEITMEDSEIGKYKAPALLLQQEVTRVLLEPIARSAPGVQGVVDLYLMPAYDDIATLYLDDEGWHVHYVFPGTRTSPAISEAEPRPLSEDVLGEVLEDMRKNAV